MFTNLSTKENLYFDKDYFMCNQMGGGELPCFHENDFAQDVFGI